MASVIGSRCKNCDRVVDTLFSMPCHDAHQLCEQCLEHEDVARPGNAKKCPFCRAVFGSVRTSLLKVHGTDTLPKEQACSPCREPDGKHGVPAEWYCGSCLVELCTECYKMHQRSINLNKTHKVVPFDDYRKKSNLLTLRRCDKPDHQENNELKHWCRRCGSHACWYCKNEHSTCLNDGEHQFQLLSDHQNELKTQIQTDDRKLRDRRESALTCKERTQDSMEALRLQYVEMENEVLRVEAEKIKQIKRESASARKQLKNGLRHSADIVLNLCGEIDVGTDLLEKTREGLNALVEFNHTMDIRRLRREIKVEEVLKKNWEEPVHPIPKLNTKGSSDVNLLGLDVEPTLAAIPSGLVFERHTPTKKKCYTVFVRQDSSVIEGGLRYNTAGVDTTSKNTNCIRIIGDKLVMLNYDEKNSKSDIITYQLDGDSVITSRIGELSVLYTENLTHFAVVGDTIVRTGGDNKTIYIYTGSEQVRQTVTHDDLVRPWGVCLVGRDAYVTDLKSGSMFAFNLSNPDGIYKLCGGLKGPSGITYHRGYLYVMSNSSTEITVHNLQGDKVNTFKPPELKSNCHDISINSAGVVAVANRDHGVKIFELKYED